MSQYKQGYFTPTNTEKYVGDIKNIYFRSSWELKFMKFCDQNSSVLRWSSESIGIPYFNPVKNRAAHYYPDFWIECKDKDGQIKKMIIEIKPVKESTPPEMKVTEKQKKPTKRYITEALTFAVNEAKWQACNKFCGERGMLFKVMTEKDLF